MRNASRQRPVHRRACLRTLPGLILVLIVMVVVTTTSARPPRRSPSSGHEGPHRDQPPATFPSFHEEIQGRQIFRYDTFGDEVFWGGTLRLHEAVAGLNPKQALGLGLKVDSEALPPRLRQQLSHGQVNLDDPSTTLALLRLDAVVGVAGFFTPDGTQLRSIGIRCALCHSTVDDSLAPGIGRRLDGWANRDLDVGAIIAAAPDLSPFTNLLRATPDAVRAVLRSWGPGKFDPELVLDGKATRPDGEPGAVLIPPAFGLAGVELTTSTGWGPISYWNNFVAVLEMHGQGTFVDPRLNDPQRFPIAAANGLFAVEHVPDLVTPKLPALRAYQFALRSPQAPARSFNPRRAVRGAVLFRGKAQCATCHVPPLFTDANQTLHTPQEIGIDDFQAERSPTERYRTTPLRGLWTHTKGGFYHDGRFETLEDVIDHYNSHFDLALTDQEAGDLVEYLQSL
jgi:hypothetical protein